MMRIDAHSHLDRYDELLDSAMEEIETNRIFTLSNSMDIPAYEKNLEIARRSDLVLPTFGVHPWNAQRYIDHLDDLEKTVDKSPLIGEIGLDNHFITDSSQYPAQLGIFEFFLQAARDTDNPGGWEWATGKVGMPSLIGDVVNKIADLRGIPEADLVRTIEENFARLIRNDPHIPKRHSDLFKN